jgi:hypothetical protein
MTIIVRDDADNEQAMLDVHPDDIEQLEAELPLGWWVDR